MRRSTLIVSVFTSQGQFRARANPSAGTIPYIQSLLCNVKNYCYGPDFYEDIPAYNGSQYVICMLRLSISSMINLNAAILRLLPIVKYGGPIMADENVYAAVEAGEVMVDIIRGIAISFNTTFWKKVLG